MTEFQQDGMDEVLADFIMEAEELLGPLDESFIELEKSPDNMELVNEIFRSVHTIKGASGFLGLTQLVEISHRAEDVLNNIRQGNMEMTPEIMDVLLKSVDLIKELIDKIKNNDENETDLSEALKELGNILGAPCEEADGKGEKGESDKQKEEEVKSSEPEEVKEETKEEAPVSEPLEDGMDEVLADFIMEAEELLGPLDESFIELEKSPDNMELVNEIFRSMHTIKGASGFLGLTQLVEISHRAEDVLNNIRQGNMEMTPEIMDVLLKSVDLIKELIDKIKNNDQSKTDLSEALKELGEILGTPCEGADEKTSVEKPEETATTEEVQDSVKPEKNQKEESESTDKPIQEKKEVKKPSTPAKVPQASKGEKTLRVDINRLDNLMNLVGELVLDRNRLTSINSRLEGKFEDDPDIKAIADLAGHLNRVTSDLQLAVMKTRMQPIKKVFSKFPRMVRDLAREIKKDITLEIIGEETELDKSIIEEIGDPLVHLIRNSVDHGVEMPEEREKAGKPRTGKIRLAAFHEGNNIVIEIEDDGKGMDAEKIKQKAIEKGVLDKIEAERLSQKECLNLIFAPGFSTAEKISDISGRGVGMDVVKTNITKLNGIINIESVPGKGTTIGIKLPLTIAIIHALMVQVAKDVFAIPLVSVIEIIKILKENIHIVDGQEVVNVRDSVLPLIRLEKEFSISKEEADDDCLYVVMIGLAEKRFGIVVDSFLGQEEIVIKSMGEFLKDSQEIAGATITGDGKVILILDIAKMVQESNGLQNTLM